MNDDDRISKPWVSGKTNVLIYFLGNNMKAISLPRCHCNYEIEYHAAPCVWCVLSNK